MTDPARTFPLMRQLTSVAGGTLDNADRWLILMTLAGEWGVTVVTSSGELLACDCWYNWPGGDRVGAAGYLLTAYPQGLEAIAEHLIDGPTMIGPERLIEATIVAAYPLAGADNEQGTDPDGAPGNREAANDE